MTSNGEIRAIDDVFDKSYGKWTGMYGHVNKTHMHHFALIILDAVRLSDSAPRAGIEGEDEACKRIMEGFYERPASTELIELCREAYRAGAANRDRELMEVAKTAGQPRPAPSAQGMSHEEYRKERERLIEECKKATDCQAAGAWDDPAWAIPQTWRTEDSGCTPHHRDIAALDARYNSRRAKPEEKEAELLKRAVELLGRCTKGQGCFDCGCVHAAHFDGCAVARFLADARKESGNG